MRIAHFLMGRCNPDSANGVDKTIYHLSRAQSQIGETVAIFSVTPKEPLEVPGVETIFLKPHRINWRIPASLLTELFSWSPDIVHIHSVYVPGNVQVSMALKRAGVPYVVTPHGGLSRFVTARRWWRKIPYKYLFERRLLRGAIFVHAVGASEGIREYCGDVSIVIAPNGTEVPGAPVRGSRLKLESRFPSIRGKCLIMYLGRLAPDPKGLDLLVDAFSKVQREKAILLLVGPDFRKGQLQLKKLAEGLGVGESLLMPGPVYGKEKLEYLSAPDVFVHTSRHEGLPFSVLEACAMGRPCLVTHAADPLGKIREFGAGIVCEPTSGSIRSALERFLALADEDLRRMGLAAQTMVRSEFTWQGSAQILKDALTMAGIGVRQTRSLE